LIIMAAMAVLFFAGRILWANGLFSSVPTGFAGICKVAALLPGVQDIEIANGVTFVSVAGGRAADARDGIYVRTEDGKLTKLAGAPKDFHPRGIGLYRSPDGTGIFLMAVNKRASGRFNVNSFEVTNPKDNPALVAQGTIDSGLLSDPQDVAAGRSGCILCQQQHHQAELRKVAGFLGRAAGVGHSLFQRHDLPPGGAGLLWRAGLADRTRRQSPVGGQPDDAQPQVLQPGSLRRQSHRSGFAHPSRRARKYQPGCAGRGLGGGPCRLPQWRAFAADPAKRATSQIFRVSLLSGEPQESTQVYGNDGTEISGASIGVRSGKRLLIGSGLDGRLLDCTLP
jgi:hypothetical protein